MLFEIVFNTKIDKLKFKEYLDTKDLAVSDGQLGDGSLLKSAVWDEDDESVWEGAPPHLEVAYDAQNGFLLKAGFTIDKKLSTKSEIELQIIFMSQLVEAGVVSFDILETFERTNKWEAEDK